MVGTTEDGRRRSADAHSVDEVVEQWRALVARPHRAGPKRVHPRSQKRDLGHPACFLGAMPGGVRPAGRESGL